MSRKVARSPELVPQHLFYPRSVRHRGASRREARTQVPRNSYPVRRAFSLRSERVTDSLSVREGIRIRSSV